MKNPALEVEGGEGLPVCDARSKEAWKSDRESTPGCEKTHDSKVKQNTVKPMDLTECALTYQLSSKRWDRTVKTGLSSRFSKYQSFSSTKSYRD